MRDPHVQLITDFYGAFARRDATGMCACYADDVVFSDPVFPRLVGDEARGMWRMLCARGEAAKLRVAASGIEADGNGVRAHWEAHYDFTATGRPVHNVIDAEFVIRDGLIIQHTDRFDLWRWCGMALGPAGRVLGWLPPLQNTVRKRAAGDLQKFMSRGGR